MMQHLQLCLLGIMLVAANAHAQGDGSYKHVLVIEETAPVPAEVKSAIMDGVSTALERAASLSVARATYGRRTLGGAPEPFAAPSPAVLFRLIRDVHVLMNETFMSNVTFNNYVWDNLSPRSRMNPEQPGFPSDKLPMHMRTNNDFERAASAHKPQTVNMHMLVVPASAPLPDPPAGSAFAVVRESGLRLMRLLVGGSYVTNATSTYDGLLALYDQVDGFTVLSMDQARSLGAFKMNRDVYNEMLKDESKAFMPVRVTLSVGYGPSGIRPSIHAVMRPPNGIAEVVGPKEDEYAKLPNEDKFTRASTMDYRASLTMNTQEPPAVGFSAFMQYGDGKFANPVVSLTFGRLRQPDDTFPVEFCNGAECQSEFKLGQIGRYHPTINGTFNFNTVDQSASFFGSFTEALMNKIKGTVATDMGVTSFHLAIQKIALEIGEKTVKVLPKESYFSAGIGSNDGQPLIIGNPDAEFANADQIQGNDLVSRAERMLLRRGGFDVYNKVEAGLSKAFNEKINATYSLQKDCLVNPGNQGDKQKDCFVNAEQIASTQRQIMRGLAPIFKAMNQF